MSPMDTLLSHEAMGEDSSMLGSIDTADVIGHMTVTMVSENTCIYGLYFISLYLFIEWINK